VAQWDALFEVFAIRWTTNTVCSKLRLMSSIFPSRMTEFELSCYQISNIVLTSLIVVFGTTSLINYLENNHSNCRALNHSSRSKENFFTGSIISLMIIYQYHLLSKISIHHPTTPEPSTNSKAKYIQGLYLHQCLHSAKGGKRPWGDTSNHYRNPCHEQSIFGHNSNNNNADGCSNETIHGINCNKPSNSSINHGGPLHYSLSYPCQMKTSGMLDSLSADPFISAFRDCHQARPPTCSYTNPCTPCEMSRREEFQESMHGWSRCRACSLANNEGECNFIEGVGPYCWKDALEWEVVPCKKCCTKGGPIIDENGVCD